MSLYKQEIKKAFSGRFFFVALILMGTICTINIAQGLYYLLHDMPKLQDYIQKYEGNPFSHVATVYRQWIGGAPVTLPYTLLTFFWPLLATLPYSWSLVEEIRSSYANAIIVRSGRWAYMSSKLVAASLAGGLVVALPQIINFLILCLFFPSGTPDITAQMYYGIGPNCLWCGIFYTHPYLYVFLYILLDFVFCGLFAVMGCACGLLGRRGYYGIIIPLFVLLILDYFRKILDYKVYIEISPLNYLHATPIANPASWQVILIEGIVFFGVSLLILWKRGIKEELPARP